MNTLARSTVIANTPRHLWIVGMLGLIFSVFGCYDYLMTNMRIEAYIARIEPDMMDHLDAFPAWLVVGWAIEMMAALFGAILLLSRSKWAVIAFGLSVSLMAVSQAYQMSVGLPASMKTAGYWSQVVAIWAIAVTLLAYSFIALRRGILN